MLALSHFPIKSLLSQFNKCEKLESKGGDASNDRSPVVVMVMGLAITPLALLLVIMSYRYSALNLPASSSPFIMTCTLHGLLLIMLTYSQSHDPLQQVPRTLFPNRSTTILPAHLARVNHVFIYNDYSNAPFAGANLSTFSYQGNGITRGSVRAA